MAPPTGPIDHALRVLNAHAHREGFGLHENASIVQQAKAVARAVAQGQHHMACSQFAELTALAILDFQTCDLAAFWPAFDQHVHHALLKAHLAPQRYDLFAQVLDHFDQFESADVRVRCKQNLGRRASLHKLVHDFAAQVARVFDLAVKLAVRKCASATFTKLNIAFGV